MDYFVLQFAHSSSKNTFFLETIEEIANKSKKTHNFSYEAGLKEQAAKLLFILKNTDMIYNIYDQLDSIYRTWKLSQFNFKNLIKELITAASNGQVSEFDPKRSDFLNKHNSILVKERNDAWMLKFLVLINQGSTLNAVSVMHLIRRCRA